MDIKIEIRALLQSEPMSDRRFDASPSNHIFDQVTPGSGRTPDSIRYSHKWNMSLKEFFS